MRQVPVSLQFCSLLIATCWVAPICGGACASGQSPDNPFADQFAKAYSQIRPNETEADALVVGAKQQKQFPLAGTQADGIDIGKCTESAENTTGSVAGLAGPVMPTAAPKRDQKTFVVPEVPDFLSAVNPIRVGSSELDVVRPSSVTQVPLELTDRPSLQVEPSNVADRPIVRVAEGPGQMTRIDRGVLPNNQTAEVVQSAPAQMAASNSKGFPRPKFELDSTFLVEDATKPASRDIAWWKQVVTQPIRTEATGQPVEANVLVYQVIANSPRIQAISQTPLIREQQVEEARAEFDPVSFLRTEFQDRVDPVGDNLSITNDGTGFLDDHIWSADAGFRRKTLTGAKYELNQRLGFRNSNSAFFNPQDQATATLSLNVSQPLLKGRGHYYNKSQILIAQATGDVAWNSFLAELQDEVQRSVEAYWRLYFDRTVYLQKQRNVQRAIDILEILEGRAELDSLPSQIARARSAVLSRKTALANARRDIRNSETEIRRLTADRDWQASQNIELLPQEVPFLDGPQLELEAVITQALENRTEIKETLERARVAAIQRDISINELLPELSFLMGTYVSALQGETDFADTFIDQFGSVKPGYSVGLEFKMPVGNRAAQSRMIQRKLQLKKIKAEVDETMQNVVAESQIALRRVQSARETLLAAEEAIFAAEMDLKQNRGRWEAFALVEGDLTEGQTPTTILDQLLDSQERLTAAELVYAQAELELKTAETALQRTMGTLLIQRDISPTVVCEEGLPTVAAEPFSQ